MTQTLSQPPAADETACDRERVETILRQIDALPTLSPIATRVLQLSGSDDSDMREIADLAQSDPALSAKLLSLVRRSHLGVNATTVDRAVTLLGLQAVRAAVLSISVFELLHDGSPSGEPHRTGVDRRELWLHAVATACAAEMLAERQGAGDALPAEAFVCGLLHDLGKIAMDLIIPRAFGRLVEVCDRQRVDFARVARRVVGIDHHVVGKRLGERWGLPLVIQDAMWLHGQDPDALPDLQHETILRIVIHADALSQALGIGWSGEHERRRPIGETLAACEIDPDELDAFREDLHSRVEKHALTLGLMSPDDPGMLARSLASANEELGKMSAVLDQRVRRADESQAALEEIAQLLDLAAGTTGVVETLEVVARSAERVLRARVPGVLWQRRSGAAIELIALDGAGARCVQLEANAADTGDLSSTFSGPAPGIAGAALVLTAADHLGASERTDRWTTHAVIPGNGSAAAIIVDPAEPDRTEPPGGLEAVTRVWSAAIVGAARYEGVRTLGERLADANAELISAQAGLIEARSMERLARLAAGAAHEMNTPLAVISGNAQLLLASRNGDEEQTASRRIVEAAETLSDLISALHFFADPPAPEPKRVSIESVVWEAVAETMHRARGSADEDEEGRAPTDSLISPTFAADLEPVRIDAEQVRAALTEVLLNAIQSEPRTGIDVRVERDGVDDRLLIVVADDGVGMSDQTRTRAFDPFFSSRPAGRRRGLGLTRARRLVELHGGDIELSSEPDVGTTVRIAFNVRSREEDPDALRGAA